MDVKNDKILKDDIARKVYDKIIHSKKSNRLVYPKPFVSGYWAEEDDCSGFTAFDNRTGNCWVESFKAENEVLEWLGVCIEHEYMATKTIEYFNATDDPENIVFKGNTSKIEISCGKCNTMFTEEELGEVWWK